MTGRTVIRKVALISIAVLLAVLLNGCWSYRGIDQTTIISGVAIDKDPTTGIFHLTSEIVDLTEDIKQIGIRSKIVESEGQTVFEAVRNAKKRLVSKLFFGNMQVVVVSKQIAEESLSQIIDWFVRDAECRETVRVVVSQEQTAKALFSSRGIDNMLVSHEIREILDSDDEINSSTKQIPLYEIFNALEDEATSSFVLPAFHIVLNDDKPTTEVSGAALFKDDKMVGFLTPEETRYYLFVINEVNGGILTTASVSGGSDNISFEIATNTTKKSYSYQDGKLASDIRTQTYVFLGEMQERGNMLDEQKIEKLRSGAQEKIESGIRGIISKMQVEYGLDIFGFDTMIYQKNLPLWREIGQDWDNIFRSMDINVTCDVTIVHSAIMMRK